MGLVVAGTGIGDRSLVVGSKNFNEGYLLAEVVSQLLEDRGWQVERRFGLGGTLVCYQALVNAEIDIYPEYSGTLAQAILKSDGNQSYEELQSQLQRDQGFVLLAPFGFNNTYAIALKRDKARELSLSSIADLRRSPDLRYAFSHEFMNRNDGWPGLSAVYGLSAQPRGIEHGLAYQAIDEGKIDVTDVYSTDGDIEKYDLVLLSDDKAYFPRYLAAPLARGGLDADVYDVLATLQGTISEAEMRRLNAQTIIAKKTFAEVATKFLQESGLATGKPRAPQELWTTLFYRTLTHLKLTFFSLLAGILVAVPIGVFIYRSRRFSKPVVYFVGMLQTVPSIALLAVMIPLFGIGAVPAMVALFLYALLPILRNTAAALSSIDPVIKKVGLGMGLTARQQLRHIEIPLAAPTILAGIRTAAVINIGTATLAAFIGAGGLGEPIVTGLALNDTGLILEGAVPAALLAILVELLFEGLELVVIPRHLLTKS